MWWIIGRRRGETLPVTTIYPVRSARKTAHRLFLPIFLPSLDADNLYFFPFFHHEKTHRFFIASCFYTHLWFILSSQDVSCNPMTRFLFIISACCVLTFYIHFQFSFLESRVHSHYTLSFFFLELPITVTATIRVWCVSRCLATIYFCRFFYYCCCMIPK